MTTAQTTLSHARVIPTTAAEARACPRPLGSARRSRPPPPQRAGLPTCSTPASAPRGTGSARSPRRGRGCRNRGVGGHGRRVRAQDALARGALDRSARAARARHGRGRSSPGGAHLQRRSRTGMGASGGCLADGWVRGRRGCRADQGASRRRARVLIRPLLGRRPTTTPSAPDSPSHRENLRPSTGVERRRGGRRLDPRGLDAARSRATKVSAPTFRPSLQAWQPPSTQRSAQRWSRSYSRA